MASKSVFLWSLMKGLTVTFFFPVISLYALISQLMKQCTRHLEDRKRIMAGLDGAQPRFNECKPNQTTLSKVQL